MHFLCRHNKYAMLYQEFILDKLTAAWYNAFGSYFVQWAENMERSSSSAYFSLLASLYETKSKKDCLCVIFLCLSVCHPIFFFAYLCCSLCLSWSGKSEVIGFWIKESKQEWKQALIHFTLSGMMGWQETLGSCSKRAFTLNFLR